MHFGSQLCVFQKVLGRWEGGEEESSISGRDLCLTIALLVAFLSLLLAGIPRDPVMTIYNTTYNDP